MREYQRITNIKGDQKPKILIRKNSQGRLIFCLSEYDTLESEDGWSMMEIKEMINSLETALKDAETINTNESTNFLFNPTWDL